MVLFIVVICISIFIFSYIFDTQKKYTEYILQKNKKILDEKKLSKKDGVDNE